MESISPSLDCIDVIVYFKNTWRALKGGLKGNLAVIVLWKDFPVFSFTVPTTCWPTSRVTDTGSTLLAGLDELESMGRAPYYATRRSFHSLHSLRSLRRPRALSFTADVTDEYEWTRLRPEHSLPPPNPLQPKDCDVTNIIDTQPNHNRLFIYLADSRFLSQAKQYELIAKVYACINNQGRDYSTRSRYI